MPAICQRDHGSARDGGQLLAPPGGKGRWCAGHL